MPAPGPKELTLGARSKTPESPSFDRPMARRPPARPANLDGRSPRVCLLLALLLEAACAAPEARPETFERSPLRPDSLEANGWDRDCDLLSVDLDLELDFDARRVAGTATSRVRALVSGTERLRLHGVGLELEWVRDANGAVLAYRVEEPWILVDLARPLERGEEQQLVVRYSARPEKGLFFFETSKDFAGFAPQIWSLGQLEDHRHWFPVWDYPNDRATFEGRFRVGHGMVVVSNGELVESQDLGQGWRAYHWRLEQEIPTYLIAIAAGHWERYADEWRGIPVEYYVAPGTGEEKARRAFGETPRMLEFFANLLGVPFPYPKYAQVAVTGFTWGGMENASITIEHDDLIGTAEEVADAGDGPRLLVAHELAHQWFGDLVTCFGWSHLWLNEAWASYLELLYQEHAAGSDSKRLWLERYREEFLAGEVDDPRVPLARDWHSQERVAADGFGHVYTKGPWVLYMIHQEIGDEAFWLGTREYLARNAGRLVVTEDFTRAIFDASGRNVESWIEQWVEAGGFPVIEARFRVAEEEPQTLQLTLRQTQAADALVPIFDLPVDVDLHYADGRVFRHTVRLAAREHGFALALKGELVDVVVDPECRLLCRLELEKPTAMWLHQLRLDGNAAIAWRALDGLRPALAGSADARSALFEVLETAPEELLRARAAQLASFQEALPVLLATVARDTDPGVRRAAAEALAGLRLGAAERQALAASLARETSPATRGVLERLLGMGS